MRFQAGFWALEFFNKEDTSFLQLHASTLVGINRLGNTVKASWNQSDWGSLFAEGFLILSRFFGNITSSEGLDNQTVQLFQI